jgi:hypothetical protein
MADDIVTELRKWHQLPCTKRNRCVRCKAADEIVRLRELLWRTARELGGFMQEADRG